MSVRLADPVTARPLRRVVGSTPLLAIVALLTAASFAMGALPTPLAGPTSGAALAPTFHHLSSSGAGALRSDRAVPAPGAAFTLAVTGEIPTALALTWTATNDFSFANYTIERSTNGSSGPWSGVAVVTSQTTTTAVDSQLVPGSTSTWQVVESGFFGTQTTNAVEVAQPNVSALGFTTPTSSSAQFSWTDNATYGSSFAFVSYALEETINGGGPAVVTTISSVSTTTYTVQGLSSGSSYAFYLNTTDCVGGCGGGSPSLVRSQSNVVTFGTPLPLSASISAQRSVVDLAQADLFTCSPSGGVSPFRFAWDGGNGTFVAGTGVESFAFGTSGPHTISCRVTDTASTQATSATSVQANLGPVVSISTNRSSADVGQSISFTCASANGTAPVTLALSFGDGAQASGGVAAHAYGSAGRFLAGCSAVDATDTVVQVSIALSISPTLAVLGSPSSAAAAPRTPIEFNATPSNGSGSYTNFTWEFGDGAVSYSTHASHAYLRASTGSGYAARGSVVDSNGARTSVTFLVVIADIHLVVSPSPSAGVPGAAIAFAASASGGAGGAFNFTWRFGDGTVAYGPNVSHAYAQRGTYSPTVLATDRLGGNNSTALPSVAVAPPPPPAPWFTLLDAAVLVLALVALAIVVAVRVRRQRTEAELARVQGRIPPTDPSEVTKGARLCRNCGTSNLPLRDTCVSCGRPLRRSPLP